MSALSRRPASNSRATFFGIPTSLYKTGSMVAFLMRPRWLILITAIIALWVPAVGICEEAIGNVNFAIGALWTADDFSEAFNMDERIEIGAICDVKKKNWPISIAFEYLFSYGDSRTSVNSYGLLENMNVDVYCSEMYVGVKKVFNHFPSVKPFVGGGLYTVNVYVDISYDDEYDVGIGGWVGAGAYFMLLKHLDIGLEWKWSKAKVTIFDKDFDVGGNHFDLMIGYHF